MNPLKLIKIFLFIFILVPIIGCSTYRPLIKEGVNPYRKVAVMADYSSIKISYVEDSSKTIRNVWSRDYQGSLFNNILVEESARAIADVMGVETIPVQAKDGRSFDINLFPNEPMMRVGKFADFVNSIGADAMIYIDPYQTDLVILNLGDGDGEVTVSGVFFLRFIDAKARKHYFSDRGFRPRTISIPPSDDLKRYFDDMSDEAQTAIAKAFAASVADRFSDTYRYHFQDEGEWLKE